MTTVVHCSSAWTVVHPRAFHMQSVPIARSGRMRIRMISRQGVHGRLHGVEMIPLPERGSRGSRILLAITAVPAALRSDGDVYHIHDPEMLPLALLLRRVFHRRVVYDANEDYPAMMLNKRWVPRWCRPALSRTVAAFERAAARHLDGIVTADPRTLRRFAETAGSRKLVFYNFPNLAFFPDQSHAPKQFDLVYRGGISDRTGVPVLLDAMAELHRRGRQATLLLLGYYDDEASEQAIEAQIARLDLGPWIERRKRIPHEDMAATLASARVGVCPLQPVTKFLRNIPVKVFECWAAGIPVVASDLPPIRPFFRDGEFGRLVAPSDPIAYADAIEGLLADERTAVRMGTDGRRAVLHRFNNDGQVRRLEAFYRAILEVN